MVRVIMHGCNGRMGQFITKMAKEDAGVEIVAGVDPFDGIKNDYPVFKSIDECNIEADVVIDFAAKSAVEGLLDYCVSKKLPLVLCTTGLDALELKKVEDAAKEIPVLKSANMSLGINLIMKILKEYSALLADEGYDIEIVEKHHNQKKDAPSGTALALADVINEATEDKYQYTYDRHEKLAKRDKLEIGISSVRGGTIVGEHEVIFAGEDEVITFEHTAYSRSLFAKGAISAAKFLAGKEPGYYSMQDVVG